MSSSSLPNITFTFPDLALEVVDVIKLYPEILNNSYWRDATYQFIEACDRFHPYVFDIINDWARSPFFACINAANIYMKAHYDDVKWNAGFYETSNLVYGYLAPLFGTTGLIFALLTLVLIRRNSTLHIPYGIIAFFQCLLLVFLLLEYSTVETAYLVQSTQFARLKNESIEHDTYGISINNTRIDRFMVFVNLSFSIAIAFLRLYKSLNRFYALYFVVEYQLVFTVPFTKKICFVITISSLLAFMPLVVLPGMCKVETATNGIMSYSICSKILTSSYSILRVAIAICGFVLGILTVIKFRKYLKMNTWSSLRTEQERTLIIQTFCDLIDFIAIFIPSISFRLIYLSPYLVSRFMPYLGVINLMSHRPVTIACFGHSIDAIISLFLLKKILNLERKIEPAYALSLR